MSKKIIVGNWKMNPDSATEAETIIDKINSVSDKLKNINIIICPSFIHLFLSKNNKDIDFGAQSVSEDDGGAHTGEVSASMLKSMGIKYAIVGHSEERQRGVSDESISKKIKRTIESGLIPIVCIGEKSRDIENGSHFDFLKEQIKSTFTGITKKDSKKVIIAYEPVWAIGATKPMESDQICEMTIFIRKVFSDIFGANTAMHIPILYGGAVNVNNAYDIIYSGKVEGLLIGRESLNVTGFVELLKIVEQI